MSRTIPAGLLAHLQGVQKSTALCVKLTRQDGTVLGLVSLDRDLVVGGVTYEAMDPVTASAIQQRQDGSVDNLDVSGILTSNRITDTDILAGRWDGALVEMFLVNYLDSPILDRVILLTGMLGEIRIADGQYHTELRSLSQRLQQEIVEITTATCTVRTLGDSRCKIGLAAANVSAITNGPSGQVTTATPHGLITGQGVYFYGLTGMTILNLTTRIVQFVVSPTVFTLTDNTTGYGTYTGGGQVGFQFTRSVATVISPTVIYFGSDLNNTNFFTYGRVVFTTGLNANVAREIKSHTLSGGQAQLTLQEPFPFTVGGGDTALLEAGCDRRLLTCNSRFNNVVNFRGFPHLPGHDVYLRRGLR